MVKEERQKNEGRKAGITWQRTVHGGYLKLSREAWVSKLELKLGFLFFHQIFSNKVAPPKTKCDCAYFPFTNNYVR